MFNNILAKNNKVNNIRQQEFGLSINKRQIYYLEEKKFLTINCISLGAYNQIQYRIPNKIVIKRGV